MTGEVLSADSYTLPTAAADTKGGVMIGDGLTMTGEVLSVNAVGASDVSYGTGTVEDALDELKKPAAGTSVNISSYTSSSNYYECTSDGYVRIQGTSSVIAYGYLLKPDASNSVAIVSAKDVYVSAFVRKGARIFVGSANEAAFIPLEDYT